jgi:hypothetical protein
MFEFRLSRLQLQRKQILLQEEEEEGGGGGEEEEDDDGDGERMALIYFLSPNVAVEYVAFLLLILEAQFRVPAERPASLNEEFCGFPSGNYLGIEQYDDLPLIPSFMNIHYTSSTQMLVDSTLRKLTTSKISSNGELEVYGLLGCDTA